MVGESDVSLEPDHVDRHLGAHCMLGNFEHNGRLDCLDVLGNL